MLIQATQKPASLISYVRQKRITTYEQDKAVSTEKTLFDRIIDKIKNTPILTSFIVIGIVIISLSKFTTALEDLGRFFGRDPEKIELILKEDNKILTSVNISGEWETHFVPDVLDEDVTCQRLFNFIQDRDELFGRMRQVCSNGFDWEFQIKDGKVKNNHVSFFVQRKIGESNYNSQGGITPNYKWTYHKVFYKGSVSDGVISLTIQDERGYPPQNMVATQGNK